IYGSLVCGLSAGSTLIKKLQVVQNNAIRIIFRLPFYFNVTRYLAHIGCLNVSDAISFKCLLFGFELLNNLRINFINFIFSLSSSNHTYSTRSAANNNLYVLRANKSYRQHFFKTKKWGKATPKKTK